jgi:general stress protein 26
MTTRIDLTPLPQGDVRLIDSPTAQDLLASTELARLAYVAKDGTPRVLPMLFVWTGEELVLPTFAVSHKVASLRANPAVAVTIDRAGPPPGVLLLRGRVELTEVGGVLPEYARAHERYYGPEQAAAAIAEVDTPDIRMIRIALRPDWVGVIDFQTRFPGGSTADEFAKRGEA